MEVYLSVCVITYNTPMSGKPSTAASSYFSLQLCVLSSFSICSHSRYYWCESKLFIKHSEKNLNLLYNLILAPREGLSDTVRAAR